jgi:hypothetical protein
MFVAALLNCAAPHFSVAENRTYKLNVNKMYYSISNFRIECTVFSLKKTFFSFLIFFSQEHPPTQIFFS